MTVEMTGDRRIDTERRAAAIGAALQEAVIDPLVELRMALGQAYSGLRSFGQSHAEVVAGLRKLLADKPALLDVARGYRATLAGFVAETSVGNRSRCVISQTQLEILDQALVPEVADV